jgi:endonuclease YncB( thermonuclease family)
MLIRLSRFLLIIGCSGFSEKIQISAQGTVYGKVVSIADGDTFTMLRDNETTIKIRLACIDCPERKQPYSAVGSRSSQYSPLSTPSGGTRPSR